LRLEQLELAQRPELELAWQLVQKLELGLAQQLLQRLLQHFVPDQ